MFQSPRWSSKQGHAKSQLSMTDHIAVQKEVFGTLPDGRPVHCFTLTNTHGLRARVMDYGAILLSMETPDSSGKIADLTHGFDALDGWLNNPPYLGATVGRFGNRIAGGRFSLDGSDYQLATNNTPAGIPCALHGGLIGFDKVLWTSEITADGKVVFRYQSKDGEEGYPGNLDVSVTYALNDDNELLWEATATSDASTILNIIHHSYWNLSGNPKTTILDHELTLYADHYLPTQPDMIPTGEIAPVAGTPMDFSRSTAIGERIDADFEPLHIAYGYDHCWVLKNDNQVKPAARLEDPKSGRIMEILTNQPGVQLYTANFLDGSLAGKDGVCYTRQSALCLETQNFPDAPNKPHFPSCVLRPNETYKHTLIHKFSTK